jgi:hypothetical protein
MITKKLLEEFGEFLTNRGISLDVTVTGGAALSLLEITNRATRDVDVLEPEKLSVEIQLAAVDFANQQGRGLDIGWLNTAARIYADSLPSGWLDRARITLETPGLTVRTLAREDLLKLKVRALCDRGKDLEDCVALDPSRAELASVEAWLKKLKKEPDWAKDIQVGLSRLLQHIILREREKDCEPELE